MAKGIGLIGNFKGKVGNMVGYKNSASNTANTQGIRVYQPIVKNPKTAAQAEQRAKLAPINATYRALKMIIDRGNEGLPYGNQSRLAWLKQAFKAEHMPWIEKGKVVHFPVVCQLTKGSLSGINYISDDGKLVITADGVTDGTAINTVGTLSTSLKSAYPFLQDGDQITIVSVNSNFESLYAVVKSFIINPTSTEAVSGFSTSDDIITYETSTTGSFNAVIVSREGTNGEHLRSTASLVGWDDTIAADPYDTTSKTAAIESYMSSAAVNSDWAEESIQ